MARAVSPFGSAQHDVFIIHAILETFAGLALHFCKFTVPRARRILTLQTMNRTFLKGMIVRSPHHVTAISTVLIKLANGLGRSNVTHISNGVDLSAIPSAEKVPGRILFVGRLEKWKGVDTLLKTFALCVGARSLSRAKPRGWRAQDEHDQAETDGDNALHRALLRQSSAQAARGAPTLRIVGDGSERRSLEDLTRKLQIQDHVTFVGKLLPSAVYQEFAKAEIFCGLSRSEAFGNVFVEAQAAGCSVIGTRVGGIPDIVEDGVTGLLISPDDEADAKRVLERLLNDENLRRALSEKGRENAQKYDWSIIAEEYSRVYELVLSG